VERRALARELHDGFGQQLTALKFNLAALKRDVPATEQQLCLIDRDARAIGPMVGFHHH